MGDVDRKYLLPRKDLLVRDPKSLDFLPEKGAYKPWTGPQGRYWRRRVNCGDCIISSAPEKKESGKEAPANGTEIIRQRKGGNK